MVVCKFFLQGNCKFGTSCRFDHQLNDRYTYINNQQQQHNSILRQPSFGSAQVAIGANQANTNEKSSVVDTNTLLNSVSNDMISVEKGGQWPLSCYAPFKEKPSIGGFDDQSFEEIRWEYYEAVKNGTLPQYKQQIQSLLQNALAKVKALQSPTAEIVQMLKAIYDTPASPLAGVFPSNLFQNAQSLATSQFGQNSTFGNNQLATTPSSSNNIFGQANAIAPMASQTSIFGGAAGAGGGGQVVQQQSFGQSIFSNQNNQQANSVSGGGVSIFAKQQNTPFQQPNAAQSHSIFLQQNNAVAQSNTSPFAQQLSNVAFQPGFAAQQPQQQQGSIFQNALASQTTGTAPSVFGVPSAGNNSIFGAVNVQQQQHQSNHHQNNMQPTVVNAQTHSASIFGSNTTTSGANQQLVVAFGQATTAAPPVAVDANLYSKLEDLSEDDIKWFEGDFCDLKKIPDKPPTYEMCFGN